MIKNLVLGVIILAITVALLKKKKGMQKRLLISLIGMTITLTILVLPLYAEDIWFSQFTFSLLYALQAIVLGQDFEMINSIPLDNLLNICYVVIIYVLFFLQPLAAATAIISMLGDSISKIRLFFSRRKPIAIFSQINERTITIAKNLYQKEKVLILFTDKNERYDKDLKQVKAITIPKNITDISVKNKKITYYLFSENEEQNLNDSLEIIRKNKTKKDISAYVLTHSDDARLILDSCEKGNVQLEIVNEIDREIYNLLNTTPLYLNAINHHISILIVGCGKVGMEFLKAATWCGQMLNYTLTIHIIDSQATKRKEILDITCPELAKYYPYHFIEADIYSKKAFDELDKLKSENINYVFIALEEEEKNLNLAILLRRYFMATDMDGYRREPIINLWIQNNDKKTQVENLKYGEKINLYQINAFGSIEEMYGEKPIIHSQIEEIAKQVHSIYDPEDMKNGFKGFYQLEYNKKSSRAVAIHLKYKLYSILGSIYDGDFEEDFKNNLKIILEVYKKVIQENKILQKMLIQNEHERWNAYTRTDGFQLIKAEEVKKYKEITKSSKHMVAKLHPALVQFEELKKIQEELHENYTQSDIDIIENLEKILKKEIYTKE